MNTEHNTNDVRVMRCQGFELSVAVPYAEGSVLQANEAEALNQTLTENLRNNFATRLRQRQDEAAQEGTTYEPDMGELQAEFDEYVSTYEFGVRRAGTVRASADPVEREALKMAERQVKSAIQLKGYKIKDMPRERLAELISAFYEQHKDVLNAQAETIVNASKDLPDLDLSGL